MTLLDEAATVTSQVTAPPGRQLPLASWRPYPSHLGLSSAPMAAAGVLPSEHSRREVLYLTFITQTVASSVASPDLAVRCQQPRRGNTRAPGITSLAGPRWLS